MNKLAPIDITPDKGCCGPDVIVLCDGPNTYRISMEALFKLPVMPMLLTAYGLYNEERDVDVRNRIKQIEPLLVKE